eukprot:11555135-Heterocapsa_arctica.AAC.1
MTVEAADEGFRRAWFSDTPRRHRGTYTDTAGHASDICFIVGVDVGGRGIIAFPQTMAIFMVVAGLFGIVFWNCLQYIRQTDIFRSAAMTEQASQERCL